MVNGFSLLFPLALSMQRRRGDLPRLVLLDRDGVVSQDVGSPGVVSIDQVELTSKAGRAIGRLKRAGIRVAVITNQSCIGKGLLSEEGLHDIHNQINGLLLSEDKDASFDSIYFCPSLEEADPRKKPSPGMILEALKDFGIADPGQSVFVGDTFTDMQAAARAKVPHRILVSTGYGMSIMKNEYPTTNLSSQKTTHVTGSTSSSVYYLDEILPFWYTQNLESAVDFILSP